MLFKQMMEYVELEPDRLQIRWISGSEGAKVGEVAREMTERIRALGPNMKMRDVK